METKRITSFVPENIHDAIWRKANDQNRSVSNISAHILEKVIEDMPEDLQMKFFGFSIKK